MTKVLSGRTGHPSTYQTGLPSAQISTYLAGLTQHPVDFSKYQQQGNVNGRSCGYNLIETCVEAPQQMAMFALADPITANFHIRESVLVKQTRKGCIQECLGCEARSEYNISPMDFSYMETGGTLKKEALQQYDKMYALEESSFCMRCCWRDGRPMEIKLSDTPGGRHIVTYHKPYGCPVCCRLQLGEGCCGVPCCFMLPETVTMATDGKELNRSRYICDLFMCVPKFAYSENGRDVYRLQPQTCCGGCCVACDVRHPFAVPFFFHEPRTLARITDGYGYMDAHKHPQIRKLWSGMRQECCTTADNFAVFFPRGSDAKRKAGLLGLTFLLDFTIFEHHK